MLIFGKGEVLIATPFCRMLYKNEERNTSHEETFKKLSETSQEFTSFGDIQQYRTVT